MERNEIGNNGLKEAVANAALQALTEGTDYDSIDGLTCTFGYLFDIEGHGLEGLFKIITDKCTAYFAVRGDSVMRLNFTEEQFTAAKETFLERHK